MKSESYPEDIRDSSWNVGVGVDEKESVVGVGDV